jgi:hypothetical protein
VLVTLRTLNACWNQIFIGGKTKPGVEQLNLVKRAQARYVRLHFRHLPFQRKKDPLPEEVLVSSLQNLMTLLADFGALRIVMLVTPGVRVNEASQVYQLSVGAFN